MNLYFQWLTINKGMGLQIPIDISNSFSVSWTMLRCFGYSEGKYYAALKKIKKVQLVINIDPKIIGTNVLIADCFLLFRWSQEYIDCGEAQTTANANASASAAAFAIGLPNQMLIARMLWRTCKKLKMLMSESSCCLLACWVWRRMLRDGDSACLLMLEEAQKMDAEDLRTEEDKETGQCWKRQRLGRRRTAWIRKTFFVSFVN